MKLTLMDRSLYLRGLMLLIRTDRQIHDEERGMMLRIGEILGFDRGFCQETMDDIVENKHVDDRPPVFAAKGVARSFLKDGLRLALSDKEPHQAELQWLRSVAEANGIDPRFLEDSAIAVSSEDGISPERALEVQILDWE